MHTNGPGVPNDYNYNQASFKQMLKDTNKAIDEGFNVYILPESQLNPSPDRSRVGKGLNPTVLKQSRKSTW